MATFAVVRQSSLDALVRMAHDALTDLGEVRKALSSSPPAGTTDAMRQALHRTVLNLDAIKHLGREMACAEVACDQCGNVEGTSVASGLSIVDHVPAGVHPQRTAKLVRCYGCRAAIEAEAEVAQASDRADANAAIGSGR